MSSSNEPITKAPIRTKSAAKEFLPNVASRSIGAAFVAFPVTLLVLVVFLSSHRLVQPYATVEIVIPPKPNFKTIEQVVDKKEAFFGFLSPIVQLENSKLQKQREQVLDIYSEYLRTSALSNLSQHRLNRLRRLYEIEDEDLTQEEVFQLLFLRVDEIPMSMVLAQAAIESAWGTSRFAITGNNYFGQWCFKRGCGVVPKERPEGAYHEVAKFRSVQASVASYFRNINTHNAYRQFRLKRANMRDNGETLSSLTLIQELRHYSERGVEYIEELRKIISANRLVELESEYDKV